MRISIGPNPRGFTNAKCGFSTAVESGNIFPENLVAKYNLNKLKTSLRCSTIRSTDKLTTLCTCIVRPYHPTDKPNFPIHVNMVKECNVDITAISQWIPR